MSKARSLSAKLVRPPFYRALRIVPLTVWRRLVPKSLIATYYHLVSDEDLPHVLHYRYKAARQFEADVLYANEAFGLIDFHEIQGQILAGSRAGQTRFLVTFDDGFAECFHVARPILLRHRACAIFFVTTKLLDNRSLSAEAKVSLAIGAVNSLNAEEAARLARKFGADDSLPRRERQRGLMVARVRLRRGRIPAPASDAHRSLVLWLLSLGEQDSSEIERACDSLEVDWREYLEKRLPYLTSDHLRQMASEGFAIGGHGVHHHRLQLLPPYEAEREIAESCERVREITGQDRVPFAFPYSARGISPMFLSRIARKHPFIAPLFDTRGIGSDGPLIRRLWADSPDGARNDRSNLPRLIRRAWARPGAWN